MKAAVNSIWYAMVGAIIGAIVGSWFGWWQADRNAKKAWRDDGQ